MLKLNVNQSLAVTNASQLYVLSQFFVTTKCQNLIHWSYKRLLTLPFLTYMDRRPH